MDSLIAEGDVKRINKSLGAELAAFPDSVVPDIRALSSVDPFITVWLGEEPYCPVPCWLLSSQLLHQPVQRHERPGIFGYGLFHDTWAAVATLAITVAVALAGGFLWGFGVAGRCSQFADRRQRLETLSPL